MPIRKRAAFVAVVLAIVLAGIQGCSADRSGPAAPAGQIVSLTVDADSTIMAVGHFAQVSVTARGPGGETVSTPAVEWTTSNPDIATVSASGVVEAVGIGAVTIEAKAADLTGRIELTITTGPDAASHDFNDGTLGAYINRAATDLDFPFDPTGAGRGKVARFHYQGSNGDVNRSLEFRHVRRYTEPIYFKGDFYIPIADLSTPAAIVRKLIYWQMHKNWGRYPPDGGFGTGRTVVVLLGSDLVVDATYNPAPATGKTANDVRTAVVAAQGIKGNTWYTLEVYQVMETAIGRADGVLQVWLDGQLVFSKTDMTWTDPNWLTDTTKYPVPFDPADIYFKHFLVGNQVNLDQGSFDEIRYWDNVEFSTTHGR